MLKRGILTRKGIFSFLNLHITTSTAPISLLTRSMVWHMYSTMIHGCHASYTTRWMKTTQKRSWWTHPIVLRWRRMNAKNVEHVHLLREESTNRTWNGLSVFFASAANVKSRIECSTSQASEFVNEWMNEYYYQQLSNYDLMSLRLFLSFIRDRICICTPCARLPENTDRPAEMKEKTLRKVIGIVECDIDSISPPLAIPSSHEGLLVYRIVKENEIQIDVVSVPFKHRLGLGLHSSCHV